MASTTEAASGGESYHVTSVITQSDVEEHFDVVDELRRPLGYTAPRSRVHAEGLFHCAVHVWVYCEGELLLQRRVPSKDSWPGRWDVSSAGHISAGDSSLPAAAREMSEELGMRVPVERFELLFTHVERMRSMQHGRPFVNNEFNDVYVLTLTREERDGPWSAPSDLSITAWTPEPPSQLRLQPSEVCACAWVRVADVRRMYTHADERIVPVDMASYERLFIELERREALAAAVS